MKKLFVVFLILAVAGGLFAQEFSWSGEMKVGSIIDFHTEAGPGGPTELIADDGDHDERAHATMTLNYDNEGFHAELEFTGEFETVHTDTAEAHIGVTLSYEEDNWGVQLGLDNLEAQAAGPHIEVGSLWGYWYFLDHKLLLDVAYAGRETIYWKVSALLNDDDDFEWDNMDGVGGIQISFMPMDGLNFGIKFGGREDGHNGYPVLTDYFFDTFIEHFVFGLKYESDAFAVGFMYRNAPNWEKDFVAQAEFYLGETISVGGELLLEAIGNFGGYGGLGLAGNFDYHGSKLGAGITIALEHFGPASGRKDGEIRFSPYMTFEAVEDAFLLALDVDFGLCDFRAKYDDTAWDAHTYFTVTPAVYWNPQADGISDDPDKALIFKVMWSIEDLKHASDSMHTQMYIGFCWAF